jgi:superfamily II DNA/RNA helicase
MSQIDTVVLAHTHEMAHQINCEFTRFASHLPGFKCAEYYGGVPVSIHKNALKNAIDRPTVAVGTPGRMAQLIRMGLLPVNGCRRLVLDECDLLLATSIPMRADCQAIFKAMPREKQVNYMIPSLTHFIIIHWYSLLFDVIYDR